VISIVYTLREGGQWRSPLGKTARLLWLGLIAVNMLIGVLYYMR
jgi:hypothetical protein